MGCLSHRALLPACRDLGFKLKGKHRWIVELHKCPDQRKLQPPKCRSCLHGRCSRPVPISYIRQDTRDCHNLQSKFSSGETQPGSSVVPAGYLPVIGQLIGWHSTCAAICYFHRPGSPVAWCPAWAEPTLNPRRNQRNSQDMQALWWYGGILLYATQAEPQGQWDVNRNYQLQVPAKQPWPQLFPTQQTGC